jgi:hypothetical protein
MDRELALLMRVVAGAVISYFGIMKVLIGRTGRQSLWIPWRLSNKVFDRAVIFTAAIEVISAVLAILLPRQIRGELGIFVAFLFCGLTLYGSVADTKTGGCGCGGVPMERQDKNRALRALNLIVRNVLIFGTLGFGMCFGVPVGDPMRGTNASHDVPVLFIMVSLPLFYLFLIKGTQIVTAVGPYQIYRGKRSRHNYVRF